MTPIHFSMRELAISHSSSWRAAMATESPSFEDRCRRTAFLRTTVSLLGPRLRRHKTCEAVGHNELAVVFSAMLIDAVCNVDYARFLLREIKQPPSSGLFRLFDWMAVAPSAKAFLTNLATMAFGLGLVLLALPDLPCTTIGFPVTVFVKK